MDKYASSTSVQQLYCRGWNETPMFYPDKEIKKLETEMSDDGILLEKSVCYFLPP